MTQEAAHTPSILIVEDEIMVAMHMAMTIETLGYKVIGIAVDRESALKYADLNPDVVLVDCKLRDGLTGPEIGKQIALKHGATVVFVTANPQYVMKENLRHPSILGVYAKPVNDNEITEIVGFALSARMGDTRVPPPRSLRSI
jgi:two-component system, response regulator PdtaR